MSITQTKEPQGLLFSEPSCAETGIWCELSDGIDPGEWARVCRHIGSLSATEFQRISAMLMPKAKTVRSNVLAGLKTLLSSTDESNTNLPLVSIGPGKPGGEYQWER